MSSDKPDERRYFAINSLYSKQREVSLLASELLFTVPDPIDSFAMLAFLLLAIGMPLLGWFFMVVDYRAYLRSLRRAIAVIQTYYRPSPTWIHQEEWIGDRPDCLKSLDLTMPCSREEVLAAYRRKVKEVHPDRGGDRRQFDRLQKHLEESLALIEAIE